MASIALGLGLASAAGGIASSAIGANAAGNAAGQEVNQEQKGLDFQKQVFDQQQQNQAPFLQAGQQSVAQLMKGLESGKFSTPSFQAPSLQQAEQSPGFQFNLEQGDRGILAGAAATGAISGGTLKSLAGFNQGLAQNDYANEFARSMQTYQANLQGQQQAFQQLYAPAALGEGAVANINATGSQTAQNVGNLLTQMGQSQAAGTVGTANAINSGIGSAVNAGSQYALLQSLGLGPSNGLIGQGPQSASPYNPVAFGYGAGAV